jgi:hypothetical protein
MLNRLGSELHNDAEPPRAPVSLPSLKFLKEPWVDDHDEAERREIAAKFLEARAIKSAAECWQAYGRASSFEAFLKIGQGLLVGRNLILKSTGANAPHGRRYSLAFSRWIREHKFETMAKSLRSVCIDLAENSDAITAWRATLSEKQRRRLTGPLSNVSRWKASLAHGNSRSPTDLRRDAKAAWARFCACAKALPASEAKPLWRLIAAEATIHIG